MTKVTNVLHPNTKLTCVPTLTLKPALSTTATIRWELSQWRRSPMCYTQTRNLPVCGRWHLSRSVHHNYRQNCLKDQDHQCVTSKHLTYLCADVDTEACSVHHHYHQNCLHDEGHQCVTSKHETYLCADVDTEACSVGPIYRQNCLNDQSHECVTHNHETYLCADVDTEACSVHHHYRKNRLNDQGHECVTSKHEPITIPRQGFGYLCSIKYTNAPFISCKVSC